MTAQQQDWIEWAGGERPVSPNQKVKVRFPNESEQTAEDYPARPARFWDRAWKRTRGDDRLVAYLVVPA